MNYFFYFITYRPDTREDARERIRERIRGDIRGDIRERGFSECVNSTHSRIALRSIRATLLRTLHGEGAL